MHRFALGVATILGCALALGCGEPDGATDTSADATGDDGTEDDGSTEAGIADMMAEPTGCDPGMGLEPGDYDRSFMWEGENRRYKIHVPAGYDGSASALIVHYHGIGSDAGQQIFFSDMDSSSDADGYIVAYPQGLMNANGSQAWDGGELCCTDQPRDDVGFTREIVDRMQRELCIDRNHVYATGFSNGGIMSNRLACEASDLFAAVAPVAGFLAVPTADCNPGRAVPSFHMHGTADLTVPYSSGLQTAEFWAANNGCDMTTQVTFQNGVATCETWDGCDEDVVLCTLEGVFHCWPGQPFCLEGDSTEDLVANDAMWDFFQEYSLGG